MLNLTTFKTTAPQYEDKVVIIIKADYNDGDYNTETTKLWLSDFLANHEDLHRILKEIKAHDNDLREMDQYLMQDDLIYVQDFIPYGDEIECHTLESVNIYYECKEDNMRYELTI